MRSISRLSSVPFAGSRASAGLSDKPSAKRRNRSFHMRQAWRALARAAVRLCNALFPPQAAVGFLDVAPQLLALFRRHLARAIGTALALAVGIAHVVAHALALVVLHLPLRRAAVAAAPIGLRRGGRGEHESEEKDQSFHGRQMISPHSAGG